MKNVILKILILLTLIIAASSSVFSQKPNSPIVGKNQTVAFLLEQNEDAREVIKAQAKRISDLEAECAAERENSDSLSKSYESAKSEIASLRQSNDALTRAVALNEQTIALLQTDRDKWKDAAKRAKLGKWQAYAVTAAVLLLKVLVP